MHSGNIHSGQASPKQWPDFYSILDSTPDTDPESLRRSINALYVKANEQSDHRELSTRFYNQVLSQKVLPQCRRILLNEGSRLAYNRQWHLHREGKTEALSYPEFIREITKGSGTAGALLLSDDEISILPSFHGDNSPPLSALKTAVSEPTVATSAASTEVFEADEVIEPGAAAEVNDALQGKPVIAQVLAVPRAAPAPSRQKAFPVAPVAAVALLLVGGAAWNATRGGKSEATTPIVAPKVVAGAAAPTNLLKLNSLALNSDFELGRRYWERANSQAYVDKGTEKYTKSGTKVLTFWGKEAYESSSWQVVKGLKPGNYTFRAWVRRTGGQEVAELFARDYGGAPRTAVLPSSQNWSSISLSDIKVTGDKCTVGFRVKSQASKFVKLDAVEFHRQ